MSNKDFSVYMEPMSAFTYLVKNSSDTHLSCKNKIWSTRIFFNNLTKKQAFCALFQSILLSSVLITDDLSYFPIILSRHPFRRQYNSIVA